MTENSFLYNLSEQIIQNLFVEKQAEFTIVLPNKRAKVFLIEILRQKGKQSFFAPKIINIEELLQSISEIRFVDSIELLFEFYNLYIQITPKEKQQTFDQFSNWAKTLLSDFNEIDRNLIDPKHVFSYLRDIEALKRWNLDAESKTDLIDKYLEFWDDIPSYYDAFTEYLSAKKIGYQGFVYRKAVENLQKYSKENQKNHFVLAGFNALTKAEEKIFCYMQESGQATVLWDVDKTFHDDPYHDAGLFSRKIQNTWSYYKSHPFELISNHFSEDKNIRIIGIPKSVGQAKMTGVILEEIALNNGLDNTAVVLGDENLLMPVLHSLPESISGLNITMGYSAKNNPAQLFVAKLFKMHLNAQSRNGKDYVYYYRDMLNVLNNPILDSEVKADNLMSIIKKNNFTFISYQKIQELHPEATTLFKLIFEPWETTPLEVLSRVSEILLTIKELSDTKSQENKIMLSFLYAIYKVINKLTNYCIEHEAVLSFDVLFSIYKQIVDLAEVSFEGEPLTGLQIMGVLETRTLDFENVIITSVNEGTFPEGKNQNSFIPHDIKRELDLPTFKEKDAIYTYHFYHLLQRAKNIYLLYNTENEGIDAGEKSRFISQLEIEKQENHNITHEIYDAELPEKPYELMVVEKSEAVINRLKEIAEKSFSPSSLTTYIRNPMQFYFQRVLRISEVDEVEENLAANTFGTIIHETLKALYTPFINSFLTVEDINQMLKEYEKEVRNQFKEIYKEGEINKGKNLLAFEVAKRNVYNFLQQEKLSLDEGDAVKVLFLEHTFTRLLEDDRLPFSVNIGGNLDRVEQRNGKIRIVDYKTGKVEQRNLDLSDWNGLTSNIKNEKTIQLLCYAFMLEKDFQDMEIEAGIISFKNMKAGFMPFRLKEDKKIISEVVSKEMINQFVVQIIGLINEILDPNIPFEEKLI